MKNKKSCILFLICLFALQCACGAAYEKNWGINIPIQHSVIYSAQYPEETVRGDGTHFTVVSCSKSILNADIGVNQSWADVTDDAFTEMMEIAAQTRPEKQYVPECSSDFKYIKLEEWENLAFILYDDSTMNLYIIERFI